MEKKTRVLVVDDDEFLRDGIISILSSEVYDVFVAGNGMEAKKVLLNEQIDLIVSDVQMPVMDGLQLLEFVKRDYPCRFLMMSEPSSALQTRHAFMLGANEFLTKPFTKAEFQKAVDTALKPDNDENAVVNDYVALPMEEFITGTTLKVDLYVRLPSGKFIKIGNKGGSITQDRMKSYMDKGVACLHMLKKDFASYVNFNITIAQALHGESRIECTRKIRLTKHITETLITQLCKAGLKREQLEDASNMVMNTVELIVENPTTLKLLESMGIVNSLPLHSIATSIWACLIAKKVGWKSPTTFFKIALCALFHDVGMKEIDERILHKPRFEMTQAELKIAQSHTFKGRDILQSVPFMPEDVSIVAFQHHELMHGGGYPHNLKMEQIHPMARLISVANNFCELLADAAQGQDMRLEAAYEIMQRSSRDYDTSFLKALGVIVQETNQAEAAS